MDDGACETYDTSSPSSTFMSYGQSIYGRIVTAGGASITIGLALAWRRPDGGLDRTRAYGSAAAVGGADFLLFAFYAAAAEAVVAHCVSVGIAS